MKGEKKEVMNGRERSGRRETRKRSREERKGRRGVRGEEVCSLDIHRRYIY